MTDVNITITREGKQREMSEMEFRDAVAQAFIGMLHTSEAAAILGHKDRDAIQEFMQHFPALFPLRTISLKLTFKEVAEAAHTANAVTAGLECPVCREDRMDMIVAPGAEDNEGDEETCRCMNCGTRYSATTIEAVGFIGRYPAWYEPGESAPIHDKRRTFFPSVGYRVSP